MRAEDQAAYWKANLRYILVLLGVWLAATCGAGILFVDVLDRVRLFGFPLGFWFANQGSILLFVVLIGVYVGLMNALDRRYHVYER